VLGRSENRARRRSPRRRSCASRSSSCGPTARAGVRSRCRFAPPPIRVVPDSRRGSVPLFPKRHCDRTLGTDPRCAKLRTLLDFQASPRSPPRFSRAIAQPDPGIKVEPHRMPRTDPLCAAARCAKGLYPAHLGRAPHRTCSSTSGSFRGKTVAFRG
jgi:hypothetical protein